MSARTAAGEDRTVELRYRRGPGAEACPDQAMLESMVAAALGSDPFRESAARAIDVLIRSSEDALEAEVRIRSGGEVEGQRILSEQGHRCEELARSLSFAITLAIDPLSFRRKEGPPPVETATIAPAQPTVIAPAPAPSEGEREVTTEVSAGLGVSFESAPASTGGFWIETRLGWRWFTLGFEVRAGAPRRVDLEGGGKANVVLAAGYLAPCFRYGWIAACLVGGAGALYASGERLQDGRSVTSVHAAAGPRIAMVVPLQGPLELTARAEVLAALARTTLVVGDEDAWTSSLFSFSLGAGLGVRFQ